jgi:hypothetical protein
MSEKGRSMKFFIYIFLASWVFGQEASDYYDRPVHELQEKIFVKDTVLIHRGGMPQCYNAMQQILDNKKHRNPKFKSVWADSGVVQAILHSDCQTLRASGALMEYYVGLTCHSQSLKIEFWNIDPKQRSCDSLFRISMIKEIAETLSNFCDSTKYSHKPYMGFGDPLARTPQKIAPVSSHLDTVTERMFASMRADSIRQADSVARAIVRADSLAKADSEKPKIEVVITDSGAVQRDVDSISKLVSLDSITIHRRDPVIFKGQTAVSFKGKIDIDTRLECLQFLLDHKLRTSSDVAAYVILLQKYCNDKADMIRTEIPIVPDWLKYRAAAAFHHAQDVAAKVQEFQTRPILLGLNPK